MKVSVVKETGCVANVKVPARSVVSVLIGPADKVRHKREAYYANY